MCARLCKTMEQSPTLHLGRPKMANHLLVFTSSSYSRLTSPFVLLIQTYPPRLGPCKQSLLFTFLSVFLNVSFLCSSVPKTKHDHYHLTNQRRPVIGHSTTSYSFSLLQDQASQCFRIQWRDLLLFIPLSFPHVQFEFCLDH